MRSFTRVAQSNQEAFDRFFPEGDADRKMFEPSEGEDFTWGGQDVHAPSSVEGLQKLEEARTKIDQLKAAFEKKRSQLVKAKQRGIVGTFEAIMEAYPYFEAKLELAKVPAVSLRPEYFHAPKGSPEAEQLQDYISFLTIARNEVEQEFEEFLRELLG